MIFGLYFGIYDKLTGYFRWYQEYLECLEDPLEFRGTALALENLPSPYMLGNLAGVE